VQPNIFKRLYPVILVTLIVLVSAVMLGFTNDITKEKIAEQESAQVRGMLEEMFPSMTSLTLENDIYVVLENDTTIGYGFVAVGTGYGGEISILVGLENKTAVKGIVIISQNETPGLGSKVAEEPFTSQFAGVDIDDVRFGGKIDAITGATISSTAVVEAVRNTALEKVESLGE
jgi:Na+-translocating ferredoxin:NAD+ oxidoreductase subunit G